MLKFNFRKKKKAVVVKTKKELKEAIKKEEPVIEVEGELAEKLNWVCKLSPGKIKALIAVLGGATVAGTIATILTGGVAAPAATTAATAAIASITGKEIALIILASGVSLSIILAVLKGYTVTAEHDGKVLRLERKSEEE